MSNKSTYKFVTVSFLILVVCLTLTLLQGYFPLFRRQWIFLGFIIAIGVFTSFTYFTTRQFCYLLVYFIIVYINALSGDYYWRVSGRSVYELFLLLAPSIMTWYAFQKRDEQLMKMTLIVFFGIVCFETLASYIANLQFPEIIRALNHMKEENGMDDSAYTYYRLGVANYDIGHALPAVVPLLVMGIKDKGLSKRLHRILIALIVFVFVLIYISFSTTALILAVFGVFLALLTTRGGASSNMHLVLLALLFVPFVLSDTLVIGSLDIVNGLIPSDSSLHSKVIEIQHSILFDEATGDIYIREQRYAETLNAFSSNLFWGTNAKVGGHSSFLDRLATLGILGFIPLLLFLVYQLSFGSRQTNKECRIYYVEAVSLSLMMLLAKDADSWELLFTMFTVIPFMSYLLNKQTE